MRVDLLVLGGICAMLSGCDGDATKDAGADTSATTSLPELAPTQPASEFSGTTLTIPIDEDGFAARFADLFEAAAADGGEGSATLVSGFVLSAHGDPRTDAQVLLSVELTPVSINGGEPLVLTEVAGTRAYAEMFVEAATQALAVHHDELAAERVPSPWRVTWNLRSANGGTIVIAVAGDGHAATLDVTFDTPRVGLSPGRENLAAFGGAARETVGGMVPFALPYATFRTGILGMLNGGEALTNGGCDAGGFGAATAPHNWYKLCFGGNAELVQAGTVFVDLGTRDGRTIGLVRAPGTVKSVGLWVATLDRLMANAMAGVDSDASFRSVYDYRDPDGNGTAVIEAWIDDAVVHFSHAFETPPSVLQDVAFLPVPELSTPDDAPTPCAAVGGAPANEGVYVMRFRIGDSLRDFGDVTLPMTGDVHVGVWNEEDMGLGGPIGDAKPIQELRLDDVVIGSDATTATLESRALPAGHYKITAFLDLDRAGDAEPEPGDPVVLPLDATELACSRQPTTLDFGLLLPGSP